MSILPKIKATISAFLLGEEGKISKQGVLVAGATLVGAALLSPIALGGCSGCGCGCGCGACTVIDIPTPIPTPIHSSSAEIEFQYPNIEQSMHYSHSSV